MQPSQPSAERPSAPTAPQSVELSFFAEGEQALQARFRSARDWWFGPIASCCVRLGLNADFISALSLLMLVPFGMLLFAPQVACADVWAAVCLWMHVALDGLDGPVARRMGKTGPAGAVTDMFVDHTGMLAAVVLLSASGRLDGSAAAAYASTYSLSVVLLIVLNVLHRPQRFVIRTKYLFYALFTLASIGGPDLLTEAVIAFSAIHALFAAIGFLSLRRALASPACDDTSVNQIPPSACS